MYIALETVAMMDLTEEQRRTFGEILSPENTSRDVVALAQLAGMDPKSCFAYGDWGGADFGATDLTGFDFRGADLRRANLSRAVGLDHVISDKDTLFPPPQDKALPVYQGGFSQLGILSLSGSGQVLEAERTLLIALQAVPDKIPDTELGFLYYNTSCVCSVIASKRSLNDFSNNYLDRAFHFYSDWLRREGLSL